MDSMDIIPMTDALERLSYFRARNVRQTTLYRGPLDIAGEAFQVPVYVYTRTAEARTVRRECGAHAALQAIHARVRARHVPRVRTGRGRETYRPQPHFGKTFIDPVSNQPVTIEREITYQNVEDITKTADVDNLVKAYRYGKTLVPFNRIDEQQMAVANVKCMSILGFAKAAEVRAACGAGWPEPRPVGW